MNDTNKVTVASLRAACMAKGLKGYSSMGKQALIDYLNTGNKPTPVVKAGSTADLRQQCKDAGLTGYSGMTKAELEEFLTSNNKPAPKAGTTRALRDEAKTLKAAGVISGPISALKASELKTAVETAKTGTVVVVGKPAPKAGTANYNREVLRNLKGVDVLATSKRAFGVATSKLKAAQLAELVEILTSSVAA